MLWIFSSQLPCFSLYTSGFSCTLPVWQCQLWERYTASSPLLTSQACLAGWNWIGVPALLFIFHCLTPSAVCPAQINQTCLWAVNQSAITALCSGAVYHVYRHPCCVSIISSLITVGMCLVAWRAQGLIARGPHGRRSRPRDSLTVVLLYTSNVSRIAIVVNTSENEGWYSSCSLTLDVLNYLNNTLVLIHA